MLELHCFLVSSDLPCDFQHNHRTAGPRIHIICPDVCFSSITHISTSQRPCLFTHGVPSPSKLGRAKWEILGKMQAVGTGTQHRGRGRSVPLCATDVHEKRPASHAHHYGFWASVHMACIYIEWILACEKDATAKRLCAWCTHGWTGSAAWVTCTGREKLLPSGDLGSRRFLILVQRLTGTHRTLCSCFLVPANWLGLSWKVRQAGCGTWATYWVPLF